jgi:hypothetical protein
MIVSANVVYHSLAFYLMRTKTKINGAEQEARLLGPTSESSPHPDLTQRSEFVCFQALGVLESNPRLNASSLAKL